MTTRKTEIRIRWTRPHWVSRKPRFRLFETAAGAANFARRLRARHPDVEILIQSRRVGPWREGTP